MAAFSVKHKWSSLIASSSSTSEDIQKLSPFKSEIQQQTTSQLFKGQQEQCKRKYYSPLLHKAAELEKPWVLAFFHHRATEITEITEQ